MKQFWNNDKLKVKNLLFLIWKIILISEISFFTQAQKYKKLQLENLAKLDLSFTYSNTHAFVTWIAKETLCLQRAPVLGTLFILQSMLQKILWNNSVEEPAAPFTSYLYA